MKYFLSIIALVLNTAVLRAQISTTLPIDTSKQKKGGTSLSVGTGGVKISKDGAKKKTVELQFGMLDLGINSLIDNTNYQSQETKDFLHVSDPYANEDLFSLRSNKSVNVNIYPLMVKAN